MKRNTTLGKMKRIFDMERRASPTIKNSFLKPLSAILDTYRPLRDWVPITMAIVMPHRNVET